MRDARRLVAHASKKHQDTAKALRQFAANYRQGNYNDYVPGYAQPLVPVVKPVINYARALVPQPIAAAAAPIIDAAVEILDKVGHTNFGPWYESVSATLKDYKNNPQAAHVAEAVVNWYNSIDSVYGALDDWAKQSVEAKRRALAQRQEL